MHQFLQRSGAELIRSAGKYSYGNDGLSLRTGSFSSLFAKLYLQRRIAMIISYVDPQTLPGEVRLLRGSLESALTRVSPAVGAMTDFSTETPARVVPGRQIDDALQDMVRAGIRSLLVVDEGAALLGLITAADILGTRPIQFLQNPLCESHPCRHQDIRVADIMTPWAQLRLLDYHQVTMASAGDLADQFRGTDTTHVLVIERAAVGTGQVRGLISRSRLLRQLGAQNDESHGINH
jgi:CBS-domain-containing membrane protein